MMKNVVWINAMKTNKNEHERKSNQKLVIHYFKKITITTPNTTI